MSDLHPTTSVARMKSFEPDLHLIAQVVVLSLDPGRGGNRNDDDDDDDSSFVGYLG